MDSIQVVSPRNVSHGPIASKVAFDNKVSQVSLGKQYKKNSLFDRIFSFFSFYGTIKNVRYGVQYVFVGTDASIIFLILLRRIMNLRIHLVVHEYGLIPRNRFYALRNWLHDSIVNKCDQCYCFSDEVSAKLRSRGILPVKWTLILDDQYGEPSEEIIKQRWHAMSLTYLGVEDSSKSSSMFDELVCFKPKYKLNRAGRGASFNSEYSFYRNDFLSFNEKKALYEKTTFGVLPYLTIRSSGALIDYLSAGIPLIISDLEELKFDGPNYFFVITELAENFRDLSFDEYKELALNARRQYKSLKEENRLSLSV